MSEGVQTRAARAGLSICLFCGSSDAAPEPFLATAAALGTTFARHGVRLVYGGGGVGLMGAAARAAHAAGGEILGVMPEFLRVSELLYDEVPTRVVANMHERKRIMFEQSDAFVALPGGVGTLEEVAELLSWRRLDLHRKPIVFLDIDAFWRPLFQLLETTVALRLSPPWIDDIRRVVERAEEVLPAVEQMRRAAAAGPGLNGYDVQDARVADFT